MTIGLVDLRSSRRFCADVGRFNHERPCQFDDHGRRLDQVGYINGERRFGSTIGPSDRDEWRRQLHQTVRLDDNADGRLDLR